MLRILRRPLPPLCYGLLTALASITCLAAPVCAQDAGPQAPPPKFEIKRIPAEPHPGPPPVPENVIIQRFAANEVVMKKAYDSYSFKQTIRLDELTDPGGNFTVTGEVSLRPDGQRYMHVDQQPVSTLKLMHFSLEDVKTIASLPEFPLTPDKIDNYEFKYAGQEKLDQLNTYIFQVKPKLLSRKERFFQGVVWVDDQDFVIVKSYGKFVSEIEGNGTELPFTMFETYRENFQNKYWLPTYSRSDDYLKSDNDDLPVRLIIRSTEFKLNETAPAQAGAAASTPLGAQSAAPAAPPPTPH
jgi:hypothetical protein